VADGGQNEPGGDADSLQDDREETGDEQGRAGAHRLAAAEVLVVENALSARRRRHNLLSWVFVARR